MTTVPRVAASIDDLRVGMVLLSWSGSRPIGGKIREIEKDRAYFRGYPGSALDCEIEAGEWMIWSDPPPVPVLVPAELIDALAEAVRGAQEQDIISVCDAAQAVVDAARNGTDQ